MPETQAAQIQCPNCGTPYQAPVRSVIDVGQNPQLRQAFLAGQVNVAVCPKCRHGGLLEVPLVYHDPGAEFLAIYFPPQLNIPEVEKQRMIGDLTQSLMRSLPAEQRKGYFLNPRQFMNRQGLMDAILGTMGISQEELDRQRKKVKLLDQLLVMADDPKGLEMMAKGQDAQLDYEFFMILASALEQAKAAGHEEASGRLATLRENLLKLTTWGKRMARQKAAVASLREVTSAEQLLDQFIKAESDVVEAMAVAARPLLDYTFFQMLTERVEVNKGPERDRLARLRDQLVDITQKLDQAARETIRGASALLRELLNAPDLRAAVRQHADEIDDMFMAVLSANMQEAERRGDQAALERMAAIYEEILAIVEEGMPPEVRLINELLRAPYPNGTRALLKERQDQVTPELLMLIDALVEDTAQRDDPEVAETVRRLRDIKAQAVLLV
jgi:hypothetical protein